MIGCLHGLCNLRLSRVTTLVARLIEKRSIDVYRTTLELANNMIKSLICPVFLDYSGNAA